MGMFIYFVHCRQKVMELWHGHAWLMRASERGSAVGGR